MIGQALALAMRRNSSTRRSNLASVPAKRTEHKLGYNPDWTAEYLWLSPVYADQTGGVSASSSVVVGSCARSVSTTTCTSKTMQVRGRISHARTLERTCCSGTRDVTCTTEQKNASPLGWHHSGMGK